MYNSINLITKTFSMIFFLLAIMGFIPDWLPSESAFLDTNLVLNLMFMATAIGFSAFALVNIGTSILLMDLIGVTYVIISEIELMGANIKIAEQWEGVLSSNLLTYLQLGVGIFLCTSSLILKNRQRRQ